MRRMSGQITFTSASECHGSVVGWIGGPYHFEGFKVRLELFRDVTNGKCKEEYEKQKAYVDRIREYNSEEEDF